MAGYSKATSVQEGNRPGRLLKSLAVLRRDFFRATSAQEEYQPAESTYSLAVLGRKL